jgi:aspartate ammonia-lyase
MKTNQMKKYILITAILVSTITVLNAQDKGKKGTDRAEEKIENALSEMGLSDDDRAAVADLLMKRRDITHAQNTIIKNAEESIKEAKKVIKQTKTETDDQLKKLLTPEQMEKLKELKQAEREERSDDVKG